MLISIILCGLRNSRHQAPFVHDLMPTTVSPVFQAPMSVLGESRRCGALCFLGRSTVEMDMEHRTVSSFYFVS